MDVPIEFSSSRDAPISVLPTGRPLDPGNSLAGGTHAYAATRIHRYENENGSASLDHESCRRAGQYELAAADVGP